jgi:hypothetical protein
LRASRRESIESKIRKDINGGVLKWNFLLSEYISRGCYKLMSQRIARSVIAIVFVVASLVTSPRPSKAVSGPPPAALQSAIRSFMTVSSSDTVNFSGYSEVSLCPAGRDCLTVSNAYLVGYQIGDASGTAVAYETNTQTCASCITYTVLYAAGGPMDVSTLQSIGIGATTAAQLLGQ